MNTNTEALEDCRKEMQEKYPAEGLGCPPSFFKFPHDWGNKGVDLNLFLVAVPIDKTIADTDLL